MFSFFVQTQNFSGGRSQTLGGRDLECRERTPLVRFGPLTGSGTCRGVVSADPAAAPGFYGRINAEVFDYWLLNGEAWKKDFLPPLNPEEVAAIHDYAYTPAVSPGALEFIRATIKSLNIPRQTQGRWLKSPSKSVRSFAGGSVNAVASLPRPWPLWLAFAKICRDQGSKMLDPATHGLMGDQDFAFRQQIFNVAEAHTEFDI